MKQFRVTLKYILNDHVHSLSTVIPAYNENSAIDKVKEANRIGYDKRNFAPLSDLDETTLVNEEFEEKYCVPVNGKA